MAQFDVYLLPGSDTLLVDLQSGAVDEYNTRLLAPLVPADPKLKPLRRVNRELHFNFHTYLFMPQLMSAVRTRDIGKAWAVCLTSATKSRPRATCYSLASEHPTPSLRDLSALNMVEEDPISR